MAGSWLGVVGGLICLLVGGELLVRGAVKTASALRVSPLVIGLTLVGFGTSTPELVTSVQAAMSGSPGIAFGNIVGSNIANTLLILGAAATLAPIVVSSQALKRDGALMVGVAVVFAGVAALYAMSSIVGALFLAALALYIYAAFRQERRASAAGGHGAAYERSLAAQAVDPALAPRERPLRTVVVSLLVAALGLGVVVAGGYLLVGGAIDLARAFGVSETVIGLTIIAIGTSLPELVTSVVAAIRKQTEVAFGNIVGSNIYNILGIGGFTALAAPSEVPEQIVRADNFVMIAASLAVIVFAHTGRRLSRLEGLALLAGYGAYLVWLWP